MLQFQHSAYLFALGILPVLALIYIGMLLWRRKKLQNIGDDRLIREQILGFIPGRNTLRFLLLLAGLCAAIIGVANLQGGGKTDNVQRKGVEVVIALDVSKSMLAKDIQPDRLTRAKQLVNRMLDRMRNDRVGLVIFAGRAYLQVPVTVDYNAMKMLLQTVSPDLVPTQGTVIGEAIDLSATSFSEKEKKYKTLVLISDGEDHDETAKQKIKEAADKAIVVHTVGIGSPQGTTLYDPATKAMKLDDKGNPVISKLNEEELRSLAAAGKGTYTLLNNPDKAAEKLMNEIDGMEQKQLGSVVFISYINYFQYFLGVAFVILLVEWLLPGARIKQKIKPA